MPWSLSKYGLYKKCPTAYKFRVVDRIPDPAGPAAARGTDIHAQLESYLATGNWTLAIPEFTIKKAEAMRGLNFRSEIKLALDENWKRVEWNAPEAWVRGIIDAMVLLPDNGDVPPTEAQLGEWKTGKVYDDHVNQRDLYLTMVLSIWPTIDYGKIETIYVDQSHAQASELKREELEAKQIHWAKAVTPMLNDTFFSPRPGDHCRWCTFSKRRGGPCVF